MILVLAKENLLFSQQPCTRATGILQYHKNSFPVPQFLIISICFFPQWLYSIFLCNPFHGCSCPGEANIKVISNRLAISRAIDKLVWGWVFLSNCVEMGFLYPLEAKSSCSCKTQVLICCLIMRGPIKIRSFV